MVEPRETETLLKNARRWFARGHLVPAEFRAREVLGLEPDHSGALCLLGEICLSIGLNADGVESFERALVSDPECRRARENLEHARSLPSQCVHDQPGYLLIKAWGFGFWADVSHTLACLLLSEITGRIPIVYWGNNSLFLGSSDGDAFSLYFEPVSDLTIDDLTSAGITSIFPDKWSIENIRVEEYSKWEGSGSRMGGIMFLNRPEALVVCDFSISVAELLPWLPLAHPMRGRPVEDVYHYLASRYLKPNASIVNEVRAFYDTHLAGRSALAVHMRGSDKQLETRDLDACRDYVFDIIDREPPDATIFLLTDDVRCLELVRDRYGERVVCTDCKRTANEQGVHLLPAKDRSRLGREMMIDTYLALACRKFIGNGQSNVSAMIALMKPWPTGVCHLFSSSILLTRNYGVHWAISPRLQFGRVFEVERAADTEMMILALERRDAAARPDHEPIVYEDSGNLETIIQRIFDALNAEQYLEAALRLHLVYCLHLAAVTTQNSGARYLNILLCLSTLRERTGDEFIDLGNQAAVLDSLLRPGQDLALRNRLNLQISLFNEGELAQCESEILHCLDSYLPELAAPRSADVRLVVMDMCREFKNQKLSDVLQKVDLAVGK